MEQSLTYVRLAPFNCKTQDTNSIKVLQILKKLHKINLYLLNLALKQEEKVILNMVE
jgi:hypothetical protein